MTVYQVNSTNSRDENDGHIIRELIIDGEVVWHGSYGQVVNMVKSMIVDGDLYIESDDMGPYCETDYDGIMDEWEREDAWVASHT